MSDKPSNSPLDQPLAQSVLRDPTAIRALLQSPQARQLIAMLRRQGDLNQAARQAKNGDTASLQAMLDQVGQSREGSQILSDLKKQIPNR